MEFLLINDGRTINAKSKLEALKLAGYEQIYWKGNTPYSPIGHIYPKNVYAIKKPKDTTIIGGTLYTKTSIKIG